MIPSSGQRTGHAAIPNLVPPSLRRRSGIALRVVGASTALALIAGGSALVSASWTSSAHEQRLQLILANAPDREAEAHITWPDEADELPLLVRRAASVRTAAAVLAGTISPVQPEPGRSMTVVQVAARAPADESPHPAQTHAHIDAILIELQNALDEHDLAAGRSLVLHAEHAVLAAAVEICEHAVQSAAPDRAAWPDHELVGRLDRAARLVHLAAAARSVEPSARYAAQSRDLAAALHSITEHARDADEPAATHALDADEPAADRSRGARTTDGYANGMIPLEVLCPVTFAPGHRLRCDAADALHELNVAFRAALGTDLALTDSYRSLGGQFAVKAAKPFLAALPGTSNHGWGLAVDLGGGVESYDSPQYAWLEEHAARYGWHHPAYMDRDGVGPHEPWHWEFGTTDHHPSRSSPARAEGSPVVLPLVTEPVAAPVVPSPSAGPPSDVAPPLVPVAEPIEDQHTEQPTSPALLEPSLPDPAPPDAPDSPDVAEHVGPTCEDQTIPGSPNDPPVVSEAAPQADGASSTPPPSPAAELEPAAASDEPPLPPCPAQPDPAVDDQAEPAAPSTAATTDS